MAAKVRKAFEAVDFVVDVDDSFGVPSERQRFAIDQEALEFHGVEEQAVYDTIGALVGGTEVGYSQRGSGLKPIAIKVALPRSGLTLDERILSTPLPAGGTARQGANVELGDVVTLKREVSLVSDLSPQRPLRRNGDRRARGALRGADLRHARGRRQDRGHGLGRVGQARRSRFTASRSTSRSRRCCGTASGR